MKAKTQIKITPLFVSSVQLIALVLIILLKITVKESWSLIVIMPVIVYLLFSLGFAIFIADFYEDSIYGLCRYRISKEKVLDSDVYFLQSKPQLLFFFLFWKGGPYSKFLYNKDGGEYLCENGFKTKEEAARQIEILKNRNESKKLFLIKKVEIF